MPIRMNRVQRFMFCAGRLLSLAIGLSVVVQATGQPAYDKDALKKLETAAKNGSPEAQCNLGFQYALGLGGTKGPDMKQAVVWYTKAANQNFAPAQYRLGYCYLYGEGGVRKDPKEAEKWYGLAASNGLAEAEYDFGLALRQNGQTKEAFYWFERAAKSGRGVADAQYEIARTYSIQSSSDKNMIREEARWIYIAAANGSPKAIETVENWANYEKADEKADPQKSALRREGRRLAEEFLAARAKP